MHGQVNTGQGLIQASIHHQQGETLEEFNGKETYSRGFKDLLI